MNHAVATLPAPPISRPAAQLSPLPAREKLEEFQILRALAAAMVVAGHALDWAPAAGAADSAPQRLHQLGAAGVDLFFIISGFIIARSAVGREQPPRPMEFAVRRLLRIVPLYWFWSAVVFVWQTIRSDGFSTAQVVKTFGFFPWAENDGYVMPLLYLGWTLSYEMLFYLAVALALAARWPARRLIVAALALACASVVARSSIAWVPFLANPLWLEFAAGMLLARHYSRLQKAPWGAGALALAAGAAWWVAAARFAPLELGSVAATLDNRFSAARVAWWGGGGLCLVLGTIIIGRRPFRRAWRAPVALGDASYTWYLSQAVTLPVAAHAWSLLPFGGRAAFVAFAVGTTGAAALVLARLFEFPLHRRSVAWAGRHFRRAARPIAASSP